jgi:hypothetical protein
VLQVLTGCENKHIGLTFSVSDAMVSLKFLNCTLGSIPSAGFV